MKKIFILVIMAFLAVASSAQIEPGFRLGVRINGGLSSMNNYESNKATFGYGTSFVAEYNLKPILFLQSGVGIENIAYDDDYKIINVFYAQLPVHVGYRYIFDNGKACFIQAGPTFGIGLHGPDIQLYGSDPDNRFKYFGNNDHWCARRFDLELGGRAGIELRKFQISVGANYGVTKVFPRWGGHNFTVNLGVAYMF
ncbi:MAG: PorT family protein [Muribaculaceae bacterium]|nr:PorT family protein [Muribaculaceae bacterium]